MICDRDKLVSALNDFKKRVRNAESDHSRKQEEKTALVGNVIRQESTIRELQAEAHSLKILLEELAAQPDEETRKGKAVLI